MINQNLNKAVQSSVDDDILESDNDRMLLELFVRSDYTEGKQVSAKDIISEQKDIS